MATLLITVPAVTSHILPMLPTAEALVKRGHRVLVHIAQRHYDKVQATGAELIPMPEHCNIVSGSPTPCPSDSANVVKPGYGRATLCNQNTL